MTIFKEQNTSPRAAQSFTKRLLSVSVGLLTFMAGSTTYAEDVEIYTGVIDPNSVAIQNPNNFPNVLFVMDNSTSMSNTEPVFEGFLSVLNPPPTCDSTVPLIDTSLPFDPSVDYGYDGDADDDDNIYIYENGDYTGKFITQEQNVCRRYERRIANNPNEPAYTARGLIQWGVDSDFTFRGNPLYRWDSRIEELDPSDPDEIVECRRDEGNHGANDTSSLDVPRNCFTFSNTAACISSAPFYATNTGAGSEPYVFRNPRPRMVQGNYHDYFELLAGNITPPACTSTVSTKSAESSSPKVALSDESGVASRPRFKMVTTFAADPSVYDNLPVVDTLAESCGGQGVDSGRPNNSFGSGSNGFPNPWDDQRFLLAGTDKVYICRARFEIMKSALNQLVTNIANTRVGLMQFNRNSSGSGGVGRDNGGTITAAVADITATGARDSLLSKIDNMVYGQSTPLAESLYEAALYYRGLPRLSGYLNNSITNGLPSRDLLPNVDPNAFVSGSNTYESPIISQCQPNSIVLLSDGAPTNDTQNNSLITSTSGIFGSDASCSGNCADEVAGFLKSQDNRIIVNNPRIESVNTYTIGFNTGALSSNENQTLLRIAQAGRPDDPNDPTGTLDPNRGFYQADTFSQLLGSLQSIIANVGTVEGDLFSAPAVTVNAFNRLQNREDIYYALFRPESNPRWGGNVKKYRVTPEAKIVDVNNNDAIGDDGFFKETAQSIWSDRADGAIVGLGGAGEQVLPPRKLYANLGGNSIVPLFSNTTTSSITKFLDETANLGTSNPRSEVLALLGGALPGNLGVSVTIGAGTDSTGNTTTGLTIPSVTNNGVSLGAEGADDVSQARNNAEIAAWTLGLDIANERNGGTDAANTYVGDSIHGTPYVLSFGSSIDAPEDVIFHTTNQGILHAIAGADDSGDELWSYVPDASLFKNFGAYYNETGSDKVYGLDSEISFLVDRNVATGEVSKAHLFFGQRRGGKKLFAVDASRATETTNPISKLWTIEGGSGDYARLGETWAEPVVTQINYCPTSDQDACGIRDVLVLSGGYDTAYDDSTVSMASHSGNVVGNAIYFIDAANGQLLFMVGGPNVAQAEVPGVSDAVPAGVVDPLRDLVIPEMTHSIVSKPTVLDTDSSGGADTMFFTDIVGQVFRVDFTASSEDSNDISGVDNFDNDSAEDEDGNTASFDDVSGGRIADLTEVNVDRRFYNPLDITLLPSVLDNDGAVIAPIRYAMMTGTGYRAHPLNKETFGNRLYVLYDSNVSAPLFDEQFDPSGDADSIGDAVYEYVDASSTPDVIKTRDGDITSSFNIGGFGYYFALPEGAEKIISPGLINDFRIITTSYVPSAFNTINLSETCDAGLGKSNLYSISLLDGSVITRALSSPGISAEPVVLFVLDEVPVDGGDDGGDDGAGGVDGGPDDPDDPDDPDGTGGTTPPEPETEEVLRPIVIIGTEAIDGEELGVGSVNLGKAEKKVWWEQNRAK